MTRAHLGAAGAALLTAGAVVLGGIAPASASTLVPANAGTCVTAHQGSAARGLHGRGADTRDISVAEQERIEQRTSAVLARRGISRRQAAAAGGSVPVYVHVMAGKTGAGNVTDSQIAQQISVLNNTYAGGESGTAANTGFAFTLAGTDRFFNDTWHKDRQSTTYRAQTRKGGANALNIWLVDFGYLGIATFPWDYAQQSEDRRHPGAVLLAAGRHGDELQLRRDRDARGRALVRALPHVPGRLHDHERRGVRHPGAEQPVQRLPDRS